MNSDLSLREQFLRMSAPADCPIYDTHGHWDSFYGVNMPAANDPRLAFHLMDRAGVRMLLFCSHIALLSPDVGNIKNIQTVRAHPERMRAYCGVNPNYPEILKKDLETFDDYPDVYVGFKLLSAYHGTTMADERYRPMWEMADARRLLVLMHTWAGDYESLRKVCAQYPNARKLLGHSVHSHWDHAVQLANEFPNVTLELCAVLDERGILEKFVAEAGSEKIVFGTDFPWFDYHWYIGAVLGADITDEDRRNILYRNARRMLREAGVG